MSSNYNIIVSDVISGWLGIIENRLDGLTVKPELLPYPTVYEALRYSLLNAGKRLRPVMALEFCRAFGGEPDSVLDCACAIEMIHTYSLIHDDLPCMDDDDLRRGKPSCHAKFGEAMALLAGDALQALAAKTIASSEGLPPASLLRICAELSHLAGPEGMVGGQALDIASEGQQIDDKTLLALVGGKTCALIESACVAGCIAAGADDDKIACARRFAREFGTAFQIIDDILDVTSSADVLGKPVQSDIENDKATYVSFFGIDGARELAGQHSRNALDALDAAGLTGENEFLRALVLWQLERIS